MNENITRVYDGKNVECSKLRIIIELLKIGNEMLLSQSRDVRHLPSV